MNNNTYAVPMSGEVRGNYVHVSVGTRRIGIVIDAHPEQAVIGVALLADALRSEQDRA